MKTREQCSETSLPPVGGRPFAVSCRPPRKSTIRARRPKLRSNAAASVVPTHVRVPWTLPPSCLRPTLPHACSGHHAISKLINEVHHYARQAHVQADIRVHGRQLVARTRQRNARIKAGFPRAFQPRLERRDVHDVAASSKQSVPHVLRQLLMCKGRYAGDLILTLTDCSKRCSRCSIPGHGHEITCLSPSQQVGAHHLHVAPPAAPPHVTGRRADVVHRACIKIKIRD